MKILGIDPGLDGGLIMLNGVGDILEKRPMPVLSVKGKGKRNPDLPRIVELLQDLGPNITYLEKVSARPGNGNVSMFNFGFGFGALVMGLTALSLPYVLVLPQTWCKVMHQTLPAKIKADKGIKAKQRSLMVFHQMYPELELRKPGQRKTTVHSGMMDALLIAEYGRRDYIQHM